MAIRRITTVQVRMQTVLGAEKEIEAGTADSLCACCGRRSMPQHVASNQIDFNNIGLDALYKYLLSSDPDNLRNQNKTTQEMDTYYHDLAQRLLNYRNKDAGRSGEIAR